MQKDDDNGDDNDHDNDYQPRKLCGTADKPKNIHSASHIGVFVFLCCGL